MSTRHRAREIVLQLLYEADLGGTREHEDARKFLRSRMQGRGGLTNFGLELLTGVTEHREAIDRELSKLSTNWKLSRMAVVDRNILRLGAFEVLFGGTPGPVAVNEAILLAKRYGDAASPRFVNGVLDRWMKEKEGHRRKK